MHRYYYPRKQKLCFLKRVLEIVSGNISFQIKVVAFNLSEYKYKCGEPRMLN